MAEKRQTRRWSRSLSTQDRGDNLVLIPILDEDTEAESSHITCPGSYGSHVVDLGMTPRGVSSLPSKGNAAPG